MKKENLIPILDKLINEQIINYGTEPSMMLIHPETWLYICKEDKEHKAHNAEKPMYKGINVYRSIDTKPNTFILIN